MKTIIERGASWTLEETKLLLALWGQDLVARQATKLKRTKEVYESISDRFLKEGYERTPDQVRTRVFNMIAEYRRILKDPNPERKQKCVFFEPLDKIYQAKHLTDVKSAIDEYELVNPYSPESISRVSISSCDGGAHNMEDSNDDNSNSTLNNTSNNNNNVSTAAAKPHATTNDTTKTTNNIGGSNNKTSATNDSITDNTVVKKPSSSKEGQSTTKKLKTDSPKPGTSFGGDTSVDDSFVSVDNKVTIKGSSTSNNASSSTSNATPTAATTFTNNASTSSSSSAKQPQQSLLASSSSSTATPINKAGTNSAAFININSGTKLPMFRSQILGHTNGNEPMNMNGTSAPTARLPTTAAITSHQLYQAPVNTFDVTSSALLIDRMFSHLSKESENMREWIALEKERIALERARRSQETEREIRRERVLVETLMKFQEQWLTFVRRIDPRIEEGAAGPLPELNIPKEVLEPLNIDSKVGAHETAASKASQSSISPASKTNTSATSTSPANTATSSSASANTSTTSTSSTTTATTASTSTASTSSAASDRPHVKSY